VLRPSRRRRPLEGTDRLYGTPGHFFVHVCDDYGSGITLPTVRDDELHAFYPSAYNAYALRRDRVLRAFATLLFTWRYWRALRRAPLAALTRMAPGRLLDVGGGRGDLGVVLQRHGWRVTSLEPSPRARARRRELAACTAYAGRWARPRPDSARAMTQSYSSTRSSTLPDRITTSIPPANAWSTEAF
jgi:hypothetical protein